MSTQKQIEAAAKAILKARYVYPDGEWENCGSEDRAGAMDEAQAALEAAARVRHEEWRADWGYDGPTREG